jgi:hypothetical protein
MAHSVFGFFQRYQMSGESAAAWSKIVSLTPDLQLLSDQRQRHMITEDLGLPGLPVDYLIQHIPIKKVDLRYYHQFEQ